MKTIVLIATWIQYETMSEDCETLISIYIVYKKKGNYSVLPDLR